MRALRTALVFLLLACPSLAFAATNLSFVTGEGTVDGIGFSFTANITPTTSSRRGWVTLYQPPNGNGFPENGLTVSGPVICLNVSGAYATLLVELHDNFHANFPQGTKIAVFIKDGTTDEIAISSPNVFTECPILTSLTAVDTGGLTVYDGDAGADFKVSAVSMTHSPLGPINSGAVFGTTPNWTEYATSSSTLRTWTTVTTSTTFTRQAGLGCQAALPLRSIWRTAQSGTLIGSAGSALYRSTDNGATWSSSAVLDFTSTLATSTEKCTYENVLVPMPNSFTVASNGDLYVAVYNGSATEYPDFPSAGLSSPEAPVFRSTDHGATWSWHSSIATGSDPGEVRHVHGIAALPSGLYLLTGDVATQNGIWKWNTSGSPAFWDRKTPVETDDEASQDWRAVSIQERSSRLYWGRDTSGNYPGGILSAPVSDLSDVTVHAAVNSSVFFSAKDSSGNLYFGTSWEGGSEELLDRSVRVFGIDTSNNVSEIWKGRPKTGSGPSSFAKISNLFVDSTGTKVYFGTENCEEYDGSPAPLTGQIVVP